MSTCLLVPASRTMSDSLSSNSYQVLLLVSVVDMFFSNSPPSHSKAVVRGFARRNQPVNAEMIVTESAERLLVQLE